VNAVAGFGDVASFGATNQIRNIYGGNENVDQGSAAYMAGQVAGFGGSIVSALGIGIAANVAIREAGAASTLYHFTSAESAGALEGGASFVGQNFFWGPGIYTVSINSPAYAALAGAASTEASVIYSAANAIATPVPFVFRVLPSLGLLLMPPQPSNAANKVSK
jgi:hypothetical protein